MERLTPAQYIQRLDMLQNIGRAAQDAARLCKTLYLFPDSSAEILNAFRKLDRLLFPQGMTWNERVGKERRRTYHSTVVAITSFPVWSRIFQTLHVLMRRHDQVLDDHRWGRMIAESTGPVPSLPKQPSSAVDTLLDSATLLVDLVAQARPVKAPIEKRLHIDLSTCTAVLDTKSYKAIDPDALQALSALLTAQLAGNTPISKRRLREMYLPTCYHDTTLARWFNALPKPLAAAIQSKSGRGLWLVMPCPG
jgi:hypothetical protein